MPSRWTFDIVAVSRLVVKYAGDGRGWLDPFSGRSTLAEWTNDIDKGTPARFHVDALEFVESLAGQYKGVIFDPPYSLGQMKECYSAVGRRMTGREATEFYGDLRKAIKHRIELGGWAVSCGWNSIGMGKTHGFKLVEILLVCHGRAHNDTIVVVEQKVQGSYMADPDLLTTWDQGV